MTLADLVQEFFDLRENTGIVLTIEEVQECAMRALRKYAAHGPVRALDGWDGLQEHDGTGAGVMAYPGDSWPIKNLSVLNLGVVLTTGEWSIVDPLFRLYVERENAFRLEASVSSGIISYGRTSSEILAEISAYEANLPDLAFCSPIVSIL